MDKPSWYVAPEKRHAADLSLDDIRSMVWDALREKYGQGDEGFYVPEVFAGSAVYSAGGKYYRVGYGLVDDVVQLGAERVS